MINSSPLVSVIIPNYNHARFLSQRINSILNQTYKNIELIILDDASTDESRTVLSPHKDNPRLSEIVFNAKNSKSPFKQWHKGINLAKGEIIWIAESDDYAELEFLDFLIAAMVKHDCKIAYCDSYQVDEKSQLKEKTYAQEELEVLSSKRWKNTFSCEGKEELDFFLIKNTIPNASGVLFHKSIVSDIQWGVIERLKLVGDKLFWSLLLINNRLFYTQQPLNYHRFHSETQRSRTPLDLWYFDNLYYKVVLDKKLNNPRAKSLAISFIKAYTNKLANYRLNPLPLMPYLTRLIHLNIQLGMKLVFVYLPIGYLNAIKGRLYS